MQVIKKNGNVENVSTYKITEFLKKTLVGLDEIDIHDLMEEASNQLYDNIKTEDIDKVLILACKQKIQYEPQYSYAAARILLYSQYRKSFNKKNDKRSLNSDYRKNFCDGISILANEGKLNRKLIEVYDIEKLSEELIPENDFKFKYLGLKTVLDRYCWRDKSDNIVELPQSFWMRVAMGLCFSEPDAQELCIKIYNLLSNFYFTPSTPTLFNSGKPLSQLSSCFLSTMDDDIDSIMGTIHGQALLSKHAGGLAIDMGLIRASGSRINSTGGKAAGPIRYMKIINDTILAFDQGGKRPGVCCCYLPTWHKDILLFLDVRKNTGDDRLRCHNLNTANWIPDEFMHRVENNDDWYLFCPTECPKLSETYGDEFNKIYAEYIKLAESGKIKNWSKIKAKDLWKEMLKMLLSTAHPWINFKDPCNIRYANKHAGIIRNSNLCCMTADQRVSCDLGLVTVGELYKLQKEIKVVGRTSIQNGSKMVMPKRNSEIVKIHTIHGYSHKVTPDHKIWVKDFGWKEAQDLENGDNLLIQQFEGLFGKEHNPKLAFLCGLITGDGTFGNNGKLVIIDLWEKDFSLINEIEEIIYNLTGKASKFIITKPEFCSVRKARLCSSLLCKILKEKGFCKDFKLSIPDFIWKGTKETVSQYLRGLFYSDGTIQAIKNNQTTISLASINYKLLEDIQLLLTNYTIKSNINLLRNESYNKLPDGKGGLKNYSCQSCYRLLITSIKDCKILEENIGLAKHKNNTQFLENIKKDGYKQKLYTEFSHLEKLDNEDVYCLEVDSEEHSWTVNGIVTKNTEILEHTIPTKYKDGEISELGETATCNLGSICIPSFYDKDTDDINWDLLEETIPYVVRVLDLVITNGYYPTKEARKASDNYRYIGQGIMGIQDLLHLKKLPVKSPKALKLNDKLYEFISYHSIKASINLAKKLGKYPKFEGSDWSKGIMPIDTYRTLMKYRKQEVEVVEHLNWDLLRKEVVEHGIRNATLLAIAPTVSISSITGFNPSIEPIYSVLHTNTGLSGSNTMIDEYFVQEMKELGLWNKDLVKDIQLNNGDVSKLNIPENIKERFKTAFQINQHDLIALAAVRQKWIDQSQSLNLYYDGLSLKEVSNFYFDAWKKGLKTTYYLKTLGASDTEKVSNRKIEDNEPKVCSIDNPNCESCQ